MSSPIDVVTTFWEQLQEAKSALPADTDNYSQKLDSALQEIGLQHIAIQYISRMVLGRESASAATSTQLQAFSEALAIEKVISKSLVGFVDKEKASVSAGSSGQDPQTNATIATKVTDADHTTTLQFKLRKSMRDGRWLITDLDIEGILMAMAYQRQVQNLIRAHGLDGTITFLKERDV